MTLVTLGQFQQYGSYGKDLTDLAWPQQMMQKIA